MYTAKVRIGPIQGAPSMDAIAVFGEKIRQIKLQTVKLL